MDNSKNCSSKKCMGACIISVVVVFIFMWLFDWLVHGKMLMPMYLETSSVWRPMDQMQALMSWCIGFHFFMALVVTCMFSKYKNYSSAACAADPALAKNCSPCGRGICFGTHLGLIFGLGMFAMYIMLPVPLNLGLAWFATGLLKGIGTGIILGLLCKKKDVA